jgi:hypothetical protein
LDRYTYIERILRQIYGGQPSDDANISFNLVNKWLSDGIAMAAKKNYSDSYQIDGIAYVNNSFYTTFKGLAVEEDESFIWKVTLPQIPLGVGQNEGISTLVFKDATVKQTTFPVVWITENQKSYYRSMRNIPNKMLAYQQGSVVYVVSSFRLVDLTATVTMISGGDSTNLESEINVPDDYFPTITEYVKQQLMFERQIPQDVTNDGEDFVTTT